MNEQKQPRKLNTTGAQRSVYHAGGNTSSGSHIRRSTSAAGASAGEGRSTARTAQPTARSAGGSGGAPRRKKKKGGCLKPLLVMLLAIALIVGGAYAVIMHAIAPDSGAVSISDLINTSKEYKGDVFNILVCGVDWEEGREYSNDADSNDGMTDMILYVNVDVANKKLNMLQIPRNTYVGKSFTLSNGTTYAANNGQINSIALSNEDGVAALANTINDQLGLTVDGYVTINMQALNEVVNTFGGLEVYVPHDIEYNGSILHQGYQTLNGDAAEFFVRCRKGTGYDRSDLDRLNMQRYFYSALFRRLRTLTITDAVKLTPAGMNYITTDIDGATLAGLALSVLKIDSGSIMISQMPTYASGQPFYLTQSAQEAGKSTSILVAAPDQTAVLLNQYFRTYTGEMDVSALRLTSWPVSGDASDPNIQFMGQLDTQAELGQETENLDGSYTVTAENTGSAGAAAESGASSAAE